MISSERLPEAGDLDFKFSVAKSKLLTTCKLSFPIKSITPVTVPAVPTTKSVFWATGKVDSNWRLLNFWNPAVWVKVLTISFHLSMNTLDLIAYANLW